MHIASLHRINIQLKGYRHRKTIELQLHLSGIQYSNVLKLFSFRYGNDYRWGNYAYIVIDWLLCYVALFCVAECH